MTILSACQSAAIRLVGYRPTTIFGSSDQFELELQDLVQDVAVEIAKKHDWQALIRIHTITGDGTATAFPRPTDYARMPIDAELYDENSWAWDYHHITSPMSGFVIFETVSGLRQARG